MARDLISVVMPVYRASAEYLSRSIQSILEQDYPHWELIIVEDPSPNTTGELIKSFRDERIVHVINSGRTGFVAQINRAVTLARGLFVARMDADDISTKERLGRQIDFLISHPDIHVVGSNLYIIDERGESLGERRYPENSEAIGNNMRLRNVIAHPSVMLRKKDLIAAGGYTEEFGTLADYDLWARMTVSGKKFFNLTQPLLRYRIHRDATKNTLLKKQLSDTVKIKKKYFRFRQGWSLACELRYWAENCLKLFPKSFIYYLFIKLHTQKITLP